MKVIFDHLKHNLVAGVRRLAYRIQGNGCSDNSSVAIFNNDYANNEAHSAMCGVGIFPNDRVSPYDRGLLEDCMIRVQSVSSFRMCVYQWI